MNKRLFTTSLSFLSGKPYPLPSAGSGAFHSRSNERPPIISRRQPTRGLAIGDALTTLAVGAFCVSTTALASLYAAQRRLVWVGQRINGATFQGAAPPELPGCELLTVGPEHLGLHFSAQIPGAPTLVYFHGNGDQLAWGGAYLGRAFQQLGFGFCAVEYPGYGLAQGDPSEASVLAAAEAVLKHLETAKGVDRKSMVMVGQSIGSYPASEMARRGFGSKLILISPFVSLQEMAAAVFPFLTPLFRAFPFFLRDRLDNAALVPRLRPGLEVLVCHGTRDEVVPFKQGKALAGLFPKGTCRFEAIEGAGHNDLFAGRQPEALLKLITDFALSP
mmetsp:Transcript_52705/g.120103  ORF Transcript_52705/g.120103 Transcript_52705/m.120103 type:complete len:332 (+) Transcript_52705:60-1055(+)